jgi:hypothetical protein
MAIVNKNILKSYFETGDMPTQAQFENLIDSLIGRLDGVEFEDCSPALKSIITNAGNRNRAWQSGGVYFVQADENRLLVKDLVLIECTLNIAADATANTTVMGKTCTKKGIVQVANDVVLKDCEALINGDLYVGNLLYLHNTMLTGTGYIF